MNLNENIKALRMAKGISQVKFACDMGVTKQCVSNWENDNVVPSVDMLMKIAAYYSVTTDFLLGLDTSEIISLEGLSKTEAAHIRNIVNDIRVLKK